MKARATDLALLPGPNPEAGEIFILAENLSLSEVHTLEAHQPVKANQDPPAT
jgi:hypothetical protein